MGTMNMLGLAKRTKVTMLGKALRCVAGLSHLCSCVIRWQDQRCPSESSLLHCHQRCRCGAPPDFWYCVAFQARFLLTSTSEVYGDPLVHPQPETYFGNVNPIGERSCYDEGKRVAETLTFDYFREHGLEVRFGRSGDVSLQSQDHSQSI
jgi:GDP-mannose 4,6 dehydratase